MLLKYLKLHNFRQFKGEQTIEFSCDPNRNVTIIKGDNTSGKTTIVQAFIWALYGKSNFPTQNDILNKEIEKEMAVDETTPAAVEVCLNHANTDYIISRAVNFAYRGNGLQSINSKFKVSYKQSDGQMETIRPSALTSTVNNILPEDLSSYFFFDGERVSTISNKKDVAEAVKGLLGLSVLANTMYHLKPTRNKSVIGKLKNSLDVGKSEEAKKAKDNIEKLSEQKEQLSESISNTKNEINFYQRQKESIEQILQDNQSVAALQKKKSKLEQDIINEDKTLIDLEDRLIKSFNNNGLGFFSQPVIEKTKDFLRDNKIEDKGIPNMTQDSIDYIISRGTCICGESIERNTNKHKRILEERDFLPPQSIGVMIRSFVEQLSIYENSIPDYYSNLKSLYEQIIRSRDRIQEWNDEVDEISDRIVGKEDVSKYELQLKDVKTRLRELEDKKDKLHQRYGSCENEIAKNEKIYDSCATASDKNRRIKQYIEYAEAIHEWIKDTYDKRESELREQVEARVNDIFLKMYHGNRQVVIDDKYRIRLLTSYGNEVMNTDESTGLEKVKNFAFIAGLVDLAREKIGNKSEEEEILLSSESYPLVMDAPFTAVDKKHIGNVSLMFPQIAEQVIMALLEEHWHFAEATMGDKVGKKYYLDKQSETLTYIREGH